MLMKKNQNSSGANGRKCFIFKIEVSLATLYKYFASKSCVMAAIFLYKEEFVFYLISISTRDR